MYFWFKERNIRYALTRVASLSESQRSGSLKSDGPYIGALRASVFKCLDTTNKIWRTRQRSPFIDLASLRSICEDMIAFEFLNRIESADRDKAIKALTMISSMDAIKKQQAFMKHAQRCQPVLGRLHSTVCRQKVLADFSALKKRHGWSGNKERLPNTRQMAIDTDLLWLYDFLFAATSSIVHFEPRLLLRMGWGTDEDNFTFSMDHFSNYYEAFGKFYSLLLLVGFYKRFAVDIGIVDLVRPCIDRLEGLIVSLPEWPESISFEEMNLERPDILTYAVAASLTEQSSNQSFFDWA